jgi:hypothetical protein
MVMGMTGGFGPHLIDFVRINADGVTVSGPGGKGYRTPKKKMLIITDVDFQYANGTPGDLQTFRLMLEEIGGSGPPNRVWESGIVLGPKGSGGASHAMTAGFAVSSKARIGADVIPGPTAPGHLQHVILRGYLTSAS